MRNSHDAPIQLSQVDTPTGTETARELFREYAGVIGIDLEYQGFSVELAGLPSPYVPPRGALLIARVGDEVAGCVGLRPLADRIGEMKRLYVRQTHRNLGLGTVLVQAVILAARSAGHQELRLDTLSSMTPARALYEQMGFVEIPPYSESYLPGTCFYSLDLTALPFDKNAG